MVLSIVIELAIGALVICWVGAKCVKMLRGSGFMKDK